LPLYEYECLENHHLFEVRQSITADPIGECPECGSPVRRVIHPVGIVFKGSGFYATDSRGKGVSSSSKPVESSGSDSKGDAKNSASDAGKSKSDAPSTPKGDGG
jgi:putative FmdB family regulatory protein